MNRQYLFLPQKSQRRELGKTSLRCAVPLMSAAAVVWLAYQFWRLLSPSAALWPTSPEGAVDLMLRHEEVHRWFSGRPVYSELPTAVYPPASYVLLWPLLGWLAVPSARWLWAVTTVAALGWLIYLIIRESRAHGPLERVFVALIPLAMYATSAAIGNGQLIVLLLPALVTGLLRLQRQAGWREDFLTAALILITLVKPSISVPFFWIVLFVPGRLRPAALASLGYLVLTLFAALFQGPGLPMLLPEWLARMSALATTGGYADLHSLLASLRLEHWSLLASSVILTALGVWVYCYRKSNLWFLLGVTGLVARSWTYHGWYDDLLILLPMVALFRVAKREPVDRIGVVAGALLAITLLVMLAPGGLYLLPPPWKMLYVSGQIMVWMIGLIVLLYLTQRENKHAVVG